MFVGSFSGHVMAGNGGGNAGGNGGGNAGGNGGGNGGGSDSAGSNSAGSNYGGDNFGQAVSAIVRNQRGDGGDIGGYGNADGDSANGSAHFDGTEHRGARVQRALDIRWGRGSGGVSKAGGVD